MSYISKKKKINPHTSEREEVWDEDVGLSLPSPDSPRGEPFTACYSLWLH